jgi:uncharacterized membrane protein
MSTYEVLLFAHLLFVVTWVGTDICLQILSLRVLRAGGQRAVDFLADIEWLGTRLLLPSGFLVVIFGLLLVDDIGYDLGQTWLILALAGWVFSLIVGAGFLGPESGRIATLAADRGPEDPAVQSRARRLLLVSRIELVVLIALILDMVVKPGL